MAVLLCNVDWYPDGKTLAFTTCSGERREYLETLFESLLWENTTMAVLEYRDETGTNSDSRLVVVGCVHTSFLHIAMNVHRCLSSCAEEVFRFSLGRTFEEECNNTCHSEPCLSLCTVVLLYAVERFSCVLICSSQCL